MNIVRSTLSKLLRETADNLDAGNSELDEEQAVRLVGIVTHTPLTKEQAAMHLKIWPSRFDELIRKGKLPKGRKKLGGKFKIWYLDEIENSPYCCELLEKKNR